MFNFNNESYEEEEAVAASLAIVTTSIIERDTLAEVVGSQEDHASIITMGFDVQTSRFLLDGPRRFAERWDITPIPRNDVSKAIARRSRSPWACPALAGFCNARGRRRGGTTFVAYKATAPTLRRFPMTPNSKTQSYNGWKSDHCINNVFVFSPEVADTAFPRGAQSISGKIRAPLRSADRLPPDPAARQRALAVNWQILSY
ncbi:hypothetical protein V8E53_009977 [Lactarius tabidus]